MLRENSTFQPHISLALELARDCHRDSIERLAHKTVDWAAFVQFANHHQIKSLLFHKLREHKLESRMPHRYFKEFQMANSRAQVWFEIQKAELQIVIEAFRKKDIRVLLYKGVQLAEKLYHPSHCRISDDIDLLVPPSDLAKSAKLLKTLGYRELEPYEGITFTQILESNDHHLVFRHPNLPLAIELHWRPFRRFHGMWGEAESIWEHTKQVSQNVFEFHPTQWILVLCVHGSLHCWSRLKWLIDMHLFLKLEPASKLLRESKQFGAEKKLLTCFGLCQELLGTEFDLDLKEFKTRTIKKTTDDWKAIVCGPYKYPKRISWLLQEYRLRPTMVSKLKFLSSYFSRPAIQDFSPQRNTRHVSIFTNFLIGLRLFLWRFFRNRPLPN